MDWVFSAWIYGPSAKQKKVITTENQLTWRYQKTETELRSLFHIYSGKFHDILPHNSQ